MSSTTSSFDWHAYLELADELAAKSPDEENPPTAQAVEAAKRAAVSRAYYAAFNLAMQLAGRHGYRRKEGERSHQDLWGFIQRLGDRELRAVGTHGLAVLRERVWADYTPSSVASRVDYRTQEAIRLARLISKIVDRRLAQEV